MPDSNNKAALGLLLLAGVGAGALGGAVLGLILARRPQARPPADVEFGETVDDLKRRAEQILRELSQTTGIESP